MQKIIFSPIISRTIIFLLLVSWMQASFSMDPQNQKSVSCEEKFAIQWRQSQLVQLAIIEESPLWYAIVEWQGQNSSFEDTTYRRSEIDLIISNMRSVECKLVLWHASSKDVPNPKKNMWLPTSASKTGAKVIKKARRYKHIYKLIVDPDVRGIAIGADSTYEDEKEILLEPGVILEQVSENEFKVHRPNPKLEDEASSSVCAAAASSCVLAPEDLDIELLCGEDIVKHEGAVAANSSALQQMQEGIDLKPDCLNATIAPQEAPNSCISGPKVS